MAGSISFGIPAPKNSPINVSTGKGLSAPIQPVNAANTPHTTFGGNVPNSPLAAQQQIAAQVNTGPSAQDIANQQAQAAAAQAAAQQAAQNDIQRGIFDQQIGSLNTQIGQLPNQYNVQLGNYQGQYNQALSALLQGQQRAQTGYNTTSTQNQQDYSLAKQQASDTYNTTKQQSAKDYVAAKNTIGANAGASLNSLLRLLGARGAGGGSAATIAAPQSVARGATIQRAGAADQYGQNSQALDTSYNNGVNALDTNFNRNKNSLDTNFQNYLSDFNNQYTGLGTQLSDNTNALKAQQDQAKAALLNQLAGLSEQRAGVSGVTGSGVAAAGQSYIDQANQLAAEATQFGRLSPHDIVSNAPNYQAPAYTPAPAYQAPSLSSYTINPNATPTYQGQAAPNDYFSPAFTALLAKRRVAA